ncbi:DUF6069 family protein [Actinoplanes sp. NPDC048967]|uniref:DUF6069 family protein n=1 Tax=Actinoplanes sp. NPDC048967 TaxID=3155269 RepID=UPI00340C7FCF
MRSRPARDRRDKTARRRLRMLGTAAAALAPALIWIATVPILGHQLQVPVRDGQRPQEIGLIAVVLVAVIAAVAAWTVMAALERLTSKASPVWTIAAAVVLLVSLLPLAGSGIHAGTRVALGLMHIAVAAVVVPFLLGTSRKRSTNETGSSQVHHPSSLTGASAVSHDRAHPPESPAEMGCIGSVRRHRVPADRDR